MKILYVFLLVAVAVTPLFAQNDLETRVERLEFLVDSLREIASDQPPVIPGYETIVDTPHVQYGIACLVGTLRDKEYYFINHNDDWKIPYWVAHYLTAEDLAVDREYSGTFKADTSIPEGRRAELEDYSAYSNTFDRGHLAPNADFVQSREAMASTYILSNSSPQYRNFNRGIWSTFEKQVREMIVEKGQAWIITGNAFFSDDSMFISPRIWIGRADSREETSFQKNVAVPTHIFKAILTRNAEGTYTAYAFLIPNLRQSEGKKAKEYIISINRLEQLTGYDFFPVLNDNIEEDIESQAREWPY